MSTSLPPYSSLQQVLRRRQGSGFIGRFQYIEQFQKNFSYETDDDRRRFIVAISGEPGVGKSWLLHQLKHVTEFEQGARAVQDSGHAEGPLAVMVHIAEQLAQQGIAMPTFSPAFQRYQEYCSVLAKDIDQFSGIRVFLGDKLIDSDIQWRQRSAGWGVVAEADLNAIFEDQRQASDRLIRHAFSETDAYKLIAQPVLTMTPMWLSDIREASLSDMIALFFDDIDYADDWLEKWLFELLGGAYGEISANTLWVLASESSLDSERWRPLMELMTHFALEPLTESDVQHFLARHQQNAKPADAVIAANSAKPLDLTLQAALLQVSHPAESVSIDSDPVSRFLAAIREPQRRALIAAAMPLRITRDTLILLLQNDAKAFNEIDWLLSLPFMLPQGDTWRLHDTIRQKLLQLARTEAPEQMQTDFGRLAVDARDRSDNLQHHGMAGWGSLAWRESWLSHLYYRLMQDANTYAGLAHNAILTPLELRPEWAISLARTLISAGQDGDVIAFVQLGNTLLSSAQALSAGKFDQVIPLLDQLISAGLLETYRLSSAYAYKAWLLRALGHMKQAIVVYSQADEIEPSGAWVTGQRAATLLMMDRPEEARKVLDEALEIQSPLGWGFALRGWFNFAEDILDTARNDFSKALELNLAHTGWVFPWRGEALRLAGRLPEALSDLDNAVARYPDQAWVVALRGVILRELGQAKALADFKTALELAPGSAWIIAQRGKTLEILGKLKDALADYDRALELAPDDAWTLTQRGGLLHHLDRSHDALYDLNRAVNLVAATDVSPLISRGVVHQSLGQHDRALLDFDRVIEKSPDNLHVLQLRAQSRMNVRDYDGAISDLSRALDIEPDNIDLLTARSHAFVGSKNLDAALSDLNMALILHPDDPSLLVAQGGVYRRMGRWQEALANLNSVLQANPMNAWALAQRGDVYRRMGKNDEAVSDFARALAINPDDGWTLSRRADVYRRMDRYQESLADFARALSIDPDDAWALAHRGETYKQLGEYDLALRDFDRSIALNSYDSWSLSGRGEVFCELGDMKKGIDDFTAAIKLNPADPDLYELRGSALAAVDYLDDSLSDFTRALELDTDRASVLTMRGDLLLKLQRYKDSQADLDRVLTLHPDNVDALVVRGRLHRARKQYKEALADLDRAIALRPDDAWAMAYRGELHRLLKHYHASLTDLSGALSLMPHEPWMLSQRGETHRLLGMYSEALSDLGEALEQKSTDIWVLATRGQVLRTMGRYDEALEDYTRAIQLSPDYAWAYASRGETLRILKRYDEALADLDMALSLDPSMVWALVNRGQVYLAMKDAQAALGDFDKAVEQNPNYAWAFAGRGQAFRLLGELELALSDFHQAIALNPNFVWALINRGHVFRLLEEYQRALADFDRAITLDPNNSWAIAGRAQVNRALERYEQAQNDISRAIALTPELDSFLFRRAITHQLRGDMEQARTDLEEAIGIAQSIHESEPENWRNTFNLALYYLANDRRSMAELLYKDGLATAPPSEIQLAARSLQDYIALFPENNVAIAMQDMIRKAQSV